MSRVKSWLEVLQSLGKEGKGEAQDLIEAEAQLWRAQEAATAAATQAVQATSDLTLSSSRQRKQADQLRETLQSARALVNDASPTLARVADALDRLRVVALNVGLEGTRSSDASGRALTLVSDEVRAHVERASEVLRDLQRPQEQLLPLLEQIATQAEELRRSEVEQAGELGRAQALIQETAREIEETGKWARKLSHIDPETAVVLARTSEHARALTEDLALLRNASQREAARALFQPLMSTLSRLLQEFARDAPPRP